MIKQYDAQEEARLVAAADSKENERVDCAKQIQDMIDSGESKAWDNDEHLKFRQVKERHDWLRSEIKDINSSLEAMRVTKPVENGAKKNKNDTLLRWLKGGQEALDSHERVDQDKMSADMGLGGGRRFIDPIFKAAVTPAGNSNVLDETVVQDVIEGLHDFGGAIQCFTVSTTANGNVIKYPVYDDFDGSNPRPVQAPTGNVASQQATVQGESALSAFTQVELSAYVRNTNYLDISQFFNQDVDWDVGAFVRKNLMRRMGRQIENELTNGNITAAPGNNIAAPTGDRPVGFIERAGDVNATNIAANKSTLKWEDINNLIHAVDRAYLHGEMGLYGYPHKPGKTGFMTSWAFYGAIKNTADSQNRPLIIPSIQDGSVDMLFGYPIFINQQLHSQNMDVQYARPLYFGNWGYMVARFAGPGFAIEEFYDSGTAPSNTRRYLGRLRYDSDYIGALVSDKGEAIKGLKRTLAT